MLFVLKGQNHVQQQQKGLDAARELGKQWNSCVLLQITDPDRGTGLKIAFQRHRVCLYTHHHSFRKKSRERKKRFRKQPSLSIKIAKRDRALEYEKAAP